MKQLPSFWTHCGWSFRILHREGMVALVERFKGSTVTWEVVIIQSHDGYVAPGGTEVGPAEYMPNTKDWGRLGWTSMNYQDAWVKFHELKKNQKP